MVTIGKFINKEEFALILKEKADHLPRTPHLLLEAAVKLAGDFVITKDQYDALLELLRPLSDDLFRFDRSLPIPKMVVDAMGKALSTPLALATYLSQQHARIEQAR